ncbi:hypothetical protein [Streptodolium elevatio]|uniref:Uncharacterized protein n=1 Tax=Streptodolium elevatio TaxID=3157996 RepID=A0ABV3DHQ3_9ACTN
MIAKSSSKVSRQSGEPLERFDGATGGLDLPGRAQMLDRGPTGHQAVERPAAEQVDGVLPD